jgi:hypothetical protein
VTDEKLHEDFNFLDLNKSGTIEFSEVGRLYWVALSVACLSLVARFRMLWTLGLS